MDLERVERTINRVRAARAAAQALAEPGGLPDVGSVAVFPVSVSAPGTTAGSSEHPWSYAVDREPGSVFPEGVTPVGYKGRIGSVAFSGRFHVIVGEAKAPAATVVTSGDRPRWASRLPGNLVFPALSGPALRRAVTRVARQEQAAICEVLELALPFVDHLADGFALQLRHRQASIDRQDLVSEGWKRAYQVLDTFAGPGRPSVAWSTALYRNCRRDMARALHALDATSEAGATILAARAAHPELTDPVAVARELAVQTEERRIAAQHPGLDHGERRRLAETSAGPCRFSLAQIRAAFDVPEVVSWQDHVRRHDGLDDDGGPGSLEGHLSGVEDRALRAVEEPVGPAAAALARLSPAVGAGDVSEVLADLGLAAAGDPGAADLGRVRRRLLGPFLLPGERSVSHAALDRAGERARARLCPGGELLSGPALVEAWKAGISDEVA